MRISRRHVLIALALFATVACRESTTRSYHAIYSHTLLALTNSGSAGDSIECSVYASLPLADSIRTPWTGMSSVQVRRSRITPTGRVTTDTIVTGATIELTRGTGDSLRVAIRGSFSLVLEGRLLYPPYEASGSWRCDDQIPLSRTAPGAANGVWSLSSDRPID